MNRNGKSFEPGTKVRNKDFNRFGVVIPDILVICREGYVMVEFDNATAVTSVRCDTLEMIEVLDVRVIPEKCQQCIFNRNSSCFRYVDTRLGAVVSSRGDKRTPRRIYPHCQDEVCY